MKLLKLQYIDKIAFFEDNQQIKKVAFRADLDHICITSYTMLVCSKEDFLNKAAKDRNYKIAAIDFDLNKATELIERRLNNK